MSLDYVALGMLFFVVITLFYGIIAIHDIPYEIAHRRNHPHQDAIHAAGWVSLLTLHVLWPFLWIWAMAYRPERGWGFSEAEVTEHSSLRATLDGIEKRLAALEQDRLAPVLSPVVQPVPQMGAESCAIPSPYSISPGKPRVSQEEDQRTGSKKA